MPDTPPTLSAAAAQQALEQALALHQQGRLDQAEHHYGLVLAAQPAHPDALHFHGVLLLQTQRLAQGIDSIRRAIAANPRQPSPYMNLGNALVMAGRHAEAVDCYDQALTMFPTYADAFSNRASALLALGRQEEAVASCDRALALAPRMAQAHCVRGDALRGLHRHTQAIEAYQRAMALVPQGYPEALLGRGTSLAHLKRHEEAEADYRRLLGLVPGHVHALSNLGVVLQEMGRWQAAIEVLRQAIEVQPDHADAHNNLGVAWQELGHADEAAACFRQAMALNPADVSAHSHLLFTLSYDAQCQPQDYVAEARRFGDKLMQGVRPHADWPASRAAGAAARPLRVGLVSGDLKAHPVGFFLEGVLPRMNPGKVALVAYPTHGLEDELTVRLRPAFAGWHSLAGLDDEAAARRIRDDGIDVLVDLSGHTADNRLGVFAWKPAPVQVSWLGFLASTGVPGMDYLLADPVSAPMAHADHFTERLWHLPGPANCFTPPPATARLAIQPPPAVHQGHITFGSYQSMVKITDGMLACWAEILGAMPEARLRLQNRQMSQDGARQAALARVLKAGIAAGRVDLHGGIASREDYLATHAEVDIVLDTCPYPGITTTCEALWMGVPTVTLAGQTLLSRQGASLLGGVGLGDWVARDQEAYVRCALAKAADVPALASLRMGLRERVLNTSLFNPSVFARQLEEALEGMWRSQRTA